MNRRNALLGWGVWKATKHVRKRKRREAEQQAEAARVEAEAQGHHRRGPVRKAFAAAGSMLAVAGALAVWRKTRRSGDPDSG